MAKHHGFFSWSIILDWHNRHLRAQWCFCSILTTINLKFQWNSISIWTRKTAIRVHKWQSIKVFLVGLSVWNDIIGTCGAQWCFCSILTITINLKYQWNSISIWTRKTALRVLKWQSIKVFFSWSIILKWHNRHLRGTVMLLLYSNNNH